MENVLVLKAQLLLLISNYYELLYSSTVPVSKLMVCFFMLLAVQYISSSNCWFKYCSSINRYWIIQIVMRTLRANLEMFILK